MRHHSAVLRHAMPMKRRLAEAALAAMCIAFAVEQSFAQKLSGDIPSTSFDELAMMRH
jgi:hypothetical protein